MSTVNTLNGPIDANELGFTLMHEHLVLRSLGVRENWPSAWDHTAIVDEVVRSLRDAVAAGVRTLVDMTTVDLGADVPLLVDIAGQLKDLHVVVATGFWRQVPRYFEQRPIQTMVDLLVADIQSGIQGTSVKAGVIKNASDEPRLSELEE